MKKLALCALILASVAISAKEETTNFIDLSPSDDFNQLIHDTSYTGVVVDFYATWCPPCQQLAPVIKELAKQYPNILFIKVNTQLFAILSNKYSIKSLPTVIFLKSSPTVAEINRIVGFQKTAIKVALNKF